MNTPYFLNMISGNIFGIAGSESFPTRFYLGLSETPPDHNGVCPGEPTTVNSGYSRVNLTGLYALSDGMISNRFEISFREAAVPWGDMKYYAVYDAVTGGNLLFWDKLSENVTVDTGHSVVFSPGSFVIKVVNPK